MKFKTIRSAAALAVWALVGSASAWAAVDLPALKIDKTQTTVSGLSSGGFMAVQLHVAYSSVFGKGAGIVAGGPFYCAEGSIVSATGRCMSSPAGIPTSTLVSTTNTWATQGHVDPVSNLQSSKVYLFSGTLDSTVKPGVMDALKTYYSSFVPAANVVYKKNLAAEHAMVTDDYGNGCSTNASPYISNCNFDLAGTMLQHLYGPLPLNARITTALPEGNFVEFKQSQFISNHGMASTGWVYIPQACQAGSGVTCRLHVALHGCKQNVSTVQQKFVRNTGFNRWAESNNIVVLYPQTSTAATNSCWDWWGYDSTNYAKKSGPQMAAIKAMVDRLTSGGGTNPDPDPQPDPDPVALPAPTNVSASGATASSMAIGWNSVAGAAGYNVYRNGNKTNALTVYGTSFTDSGLAASTTYSWTVRAADADGAVGAVSAAVSGTTLAAAGGGETPTCTTASNYAHTMAGRAYALYGLTYANGSGNSMGLWNIFLTTTLKKTGPNYYVIGTCP